MPCFVKTSMCTWHITCHNGPKTGPSQSWDQAPCSGASQGHFPSGLPTGEGRLGGLFVERV